MQNQPEIEQSSISPELTHLEDRAVAALDSGLGVSGMKDAIIPLASRRVNLESLLDAEDAVAVVQSVDRAEIYQAIVETGVTESLDVLPLLSPEQWTAVVDFDAWEKTELSFEKMVPWLEACEMARVGLSFDVVRTLEEEYQLALFSPLLESIEHETWENLPTDVQETFTALPGYEVYYRVKTANDRVQNAVEQVIDSGLARDLNYTFSLIAHAIHMPPHEQELLAWQFRNARLEEDGFVPFDVAQKCFIPISAVQNSEGITASLSERPFADAYADADQKTRENFERDFIHLVNTAASASQLELSDIEGLKRIGLCVEGLINLGLSLRGGNPLDSLKTSHPALLFREGLGAVENIRQHALKILKDKNFAAADKLAGLNATLKFGRIQWMLDREFVSWGGFEANEVLKGLFNRYPTVARQRGDRMIFEVVSNPGMLRELRESVIAALENAPIYH